MIQFLYNIAVLPSLQLVFSVGTVFSAKLAERARGSRETWKTLQRLTVKPPVNGAARMWFHAASMGEFEQVKSIIESVKSLQPATQIIVTFFSPSGLRSQRKYAFADAVVYLPLDTKANARRFLELVQPTVAVFSRYDLWYNFLAALKQSGVPAVLVCATLNERSLAVRLAPLHGFFREMYRSFGVIYTAGASETEKFKQFGISENVQTAADTRFDRIASLVLQAQEHPTALFPPNWFAKPALLLNDVYEQALTLVVGSSWREDEDVLIPAIKRVREEGYVLRVIVAPHEPSEAAFERVQKKLWNGKSGEAAIPLSLIEQGTWVEVDFGNDVIVDSIGKLLRLYAFATVAFVGGGFGTGVHSVAEPAGYGVPLACGPRTERARDAQALHHNGALTVVRSANDCYKWLKTMLDQPEELERRATIARAYVHSATGWSYRIAEEILRCGTRNP